MSGARSHRFSVRRSVRFALQVVLFFWFTATVSSCFPASPPKFALRLQESDALADAMNADACVTGFVVRKAHAYEC